MRLDLFRTARIDYVEVVEASKRLAAVELELATTRAERIAAHEKLVDLAHKLFEIAKGRFENPLERAKWGYPVMLDAQSAFLEAQVGLLKAGGKLKKFAPSPAEITPPPMKK